MKLNHFTDFSMRVLMYLNQKSTADSSSLDELSERFKISRNHLVKIVQFLSNNQLVSTKRGKNGGIHISEKALKMGLGDLINLLEQEEFPVINCHSKPCVFISHSCRLKSLLDVAYQAFLDSLNKNNLSDLKFENWNAIFSM
jgi:Rrf2 family transcriptional regulator, nitric oxide-sensitive transcriptional repressor